jgi:hypothetical protein
MLKSVLEQQIFQYDSYVKMKSCQQCKRRYNQKYPGVRVSDSIAILKYVKITESFLCKSTMYRTFTSTTLYNNTG